MSEEKHKGERIAKRMARSGLCSRRDAEKWIEAGRVQVNGKTINSAALNVTDKDKIVVDGKPLPEKENTRLFLYHKPPGLVTTHKDEQGRSTVFDALPDHLPRVVSIGRLDLNTEGLLLLTNDGELSRFLELPSTGWTRKYRVRVHGKVDEKRLKSLKNGITVDGVRYQSIDAKIEEVGSAGANTWLQINLKEGKNREIRRVMEFLGLQVTRLIRTDYGPFSLGKLPREEVKEVDEKVLKGQIPHFFKMDTEKRTDTPKPKKTKNIVQNRLKNAKFSKKSPQKPSKRQKS
ncbi:MAG: pseudouridine synthase [Alphaproteobacteria bacterium]|nr:pseudouridine synthase [Alphaproteobacteria bacterium]